MTVKELRDALAKMPDDADVVYLAGTDHEHEIRDVWVLHNQCILDENP